MELYFSRVLQLVLTNMSFGAQRLVRIPLLDPVSKHAQTREHLQCCINSVLYIYKGDSKIFNLKRGIEIEKVNQTSNSSLMNKEHEQVKIKGS